MCVIAFSPKGVNAPTEEQIKKMFATNPDGAGYAYEEGNKVKYKKGFMNVADLLKELQPLSQWKNKNLAIHFRIGTAGENDAETCHPFKISSQYGELRKTEGEGPVLFHNGIIAQGGLVDEKSSDTQDFVVAFAPLLEKYSKSKTRDAWLEKVVAGNRMLIMYGKNKYKMYGDWKKDGELFVSNLNYVATYYYKPTYWETKKYNYGYEYDGSYEEYWEKKNKERTNNAALANRLFKEVDRTNYIYVSEAELDIMLAYSDEFDYGTMIKNGKPYGYSDEALCVWDESMEY